VQAPIQLGEARAHATSSRVEVAKVVADGAAVESS
jgi:hypothetical protein